MKLITDVVLVSWLAAVMSLVGLAGLAFVYAALTIFALVI